MIAIRKTLFAIFALLALVYADSKECLYCRRMDINSGFLVSYSYCNQTNECIEDAWNYLDRQCADGWRRGSSIELSLCEAEIVTCMDFESTPDKSQTYFNRTWTLPAGTYCTLTIDATQFVGRVVFDSTSYLGIMEPGAKIGDVITVESGVKEVTIYNGAESGQLTFIISFSSAYNVLQGFAATLAAGAALVNLI